MARKSRGQHNHQTALSNDNTKDISANQWNDVGSTPAHVETGMFATLNSVSTVTLSSGALLPVDTYSIVQASGSPASDTLKNITNTNTNVADWIVLTANAADTITVNHNDSGSGNIFLLGAVNKTLLSTVPMILFRVGTNWYEFAITGTIVNANISASAAIAYGKLNLSGSVVNADISNSAAIAYSKLNLGTSIVNADIATAAAIRITKLQAATTDVLKDENGNTQLKFTTTSSAVNFTKFINAATLSNPTIIADGTDTNIGLLLTGKGTGKIQIADSTDNTKIYQWDLSGATTAKKVTMVSSHTDDRTITLPDATATLAGINFAQTWTAAQTFTTGLLKVADVADSNGNKSLAVSATGSAVDYLTFVNAATASPATVQIQATGSDSNINIKAVPKGTGVAFGYSETMMIPMSDESTTAVAGTGTKVTVYMPWAGSIAAVYQSANTAPTTSAITLDILGNGGSTIFSTKPTIAAAANTGSNGVLTSTPTTFSQGDKIQFQVNTVDTGGTTKGLKMYLVVYRTA
jgi:hypothetical protein